MAKVILTPRLYFSYGQFLVYDESVAAPGCLWTEGHTAQGFARRESAACFRTLVEYGHADVGFELGSFVPSDSYERVIAVPFAVVTGRVVIDGPDESGAQRVIAVPAGNYRAVVAQRSVGDEEELIDLFFDPIEEPLRQSVVVVADEQLDVPRRLLESADVA